MGWLQSTSSHCGPGGTFFGAALEVVHSVELVMEKQISVAWLGSAWPKVPVEKT